MMTLDENELILQAQKGNAMAFEQLVQNYDRQVLSIALNFTKHQEEAKDIYQEVFIRVFRALPKFRFESKFSTWLHKITTNVCLTHRSSSKRHKLASLDEELHDDEGGSRTLLDTIPDKSVSDQQATDMEIMDRVSEAVETLSPQQKMVFTLRHLHGYKLKEIAEMMNCSEGAVKKYLFLATEKMRGQLRSLL
jgi:RNA polymerase sigma-70 factor, ECF subfamily